MIREVGKRLLDRLLLALKEKGHGRPQQKKRRERTPFGSIDAVIEAAAIAGVGDLIVILEETDESRMRVRPGVGSPRLLLPGMPLSYSRFQRAIEANSCALPR